MFASSPEGASTQQSVDVTTSQSCSEVSSKKKTTQTNFNVSEPQDDILIPALVDEVVEGGRCCDNGLKPDGIKRVMDKIAPLIKDAMITEKRVKNRITTLKENFLLAKEAIAQSGFNLSEDGRVMADDAVWVRYIQSHPKASILRGTKVCDYDKLQIIFGNDQATGEFATKRNDCIPPTPLKSIDIDLEESQSVDNETVFVEGDSSHENSPRAIDRTNLLAAPPKRRRLLDILQRFETAMDRVVESTGKLAEAFQKPVVLPSVMSALKAIPELTVEERVRAIHKMGTNLYLVDIFFALDEDTRFEWLKSLLV